MIEDGQLEIDKEYSQRAIRVPGYNFVKGGRWIPCSERLPEESLNSVIGWDDYRKRCCFVQYYSGRWNLGDNSESVKIVAWMPLPEPYKPEVEQ